jgi:hypothetical protein
MMEPIAIVSKPAAKESMRGTNTAKNTIRDNLEGPWRVAHANRHYAGGHSCWPWKWRNRAALGERAVAQESDGAPGATKDNIQEE